MKQILKTAFSTLLISSVMVACEKDLDDEMYLRDEYLGEWMVFESEGRFAPQSYDVQIEAGTSSGDIIIRGLYDYDTLSAHGSVDGYHMHIPLQQLLMFQFSGQGQASTDFEQITIHFYVQDPSGVDSVKAILTR